MTAQSTVKNGTYKVKISSGTGIGDAFVVFEAFSPISEGRSVNYQNNDIVHLPTSILSYTNTSARHFEIAGKLVSRTPSEAMANSYYVDVIRSWALPDFGNSGATPPVLYLSAYYNKNINKVPCLLRSYGIAYPEDVDWIYINSDGTSLADPMPVICTIQVTLEEAYSPAQITKQNWRMTMLTINDVANKAPPFFVYGQPAGNYGGGQQPTIGQGDSTTGIGFTGIAQSNILTAGQISANISAAAKAQPATAPKLVASSTLQLAPSNFGSGSPLQSSSPTSMIA